MPSEVYEESIDLSIGLLNAEAPDASRASLCYPMPELVTTGRVEKRTFRTVILENSFLKATVIPALGGRILSLLDKRQGTELFTHGDVLIPTPGGIRGAQLEHGLQLRLDRGHERQNSMGFVDVQLVQPEDERDPAMMWFGELESGSGLSLNCRYAVPPDRAELILEVRAFNRSLKSTPYDPSVCAVVKGQAYFEHTRGGALIYDNERDCGLALWPGSQPMDSASFNESHLSISRFAHGLDKRLGPRQLDVWDVRIQPLTGLSGLDGSSPEVAFSFGEDLKILSSQQRLNHKLLILTTDDQTLEAGIELYPERVSTLALPNEIKALVIQDEAKNEVFRHEEPLESLTHWSAVIADAHPPAELPRDLPIKALQRAGFEPSLKHLAHLILGMNLVAESRFAEAETEFESALLYNAEDHLTWWAKAVASRLSGREDERTDLLNAHFLAPLEPALRAEAFLSQAPNAERDPNPLLRPLEDNPESFIEVACLLIDCGLWEDAARWIDEALRHRDLQMLRYLFAYCHLRRTGMAFEAAKDVQLAAKQPLAPPYPWRPVEIKALASLVEAFPNEDRLKEVVAVTRLIAR